MEEEIKRFLRDNNFLPLTKWKAFEIIHKGVPPKNQRKKNDLNNIKNHVLKKSGLYIYEKNRKIIYVGKAKSLFDRIKNHYVLAYQELPGDTKDKIWHKFFFSKKNLGKLKIYWKEQKEEKVRQIIEKMLDYVLEPTFNSFFKKHENR
jgi:hypothetical protein